jgi:hypothetical protein
MTATVRSAGTTPAVEELEDPPVPRDRRRSLYSVSAMWSGFPVVWC